MGSPSRARAATGSSMQRTSSQQTQARLFDWLPKSIRLHTIAMIGEFVGTFLFLFFAFSATQVANTTAPTSEAPSATSASAPNTSALLYIALAFGFSLAVNAWVFFRITGGMFNPAVTLGMCLIGAVPWLRGGLIFISQLLAGMASSAVVYALFPGTLAVNVSLSPGTSVVRGLFIEMFLTAELVFTIFMLAAEKHKATFIAPVGIGLALFIAELSGVFYTGGALNPTRAFGPAVVNKDFPSYHWIYWIGPALGSLVAVGFYKLVKALEYETANPGQDATSEEEAMQEEPSEEENQSYPGDGSGEQNGHPVRFQPQPQGNPNQLYGKEEGYNQTYHHQVNQNQVYQYPQTSPTTHSPRYSRRSEEAYV